MKEFSLKVWAKNVGAHYTWQNMVFHNGKRVNTSGSYNYYKYTQINKATSKYMQQNLSAKNWIIRVGDANIPISIIGRPTRQNISNDTEGLDNTAN